ncbi:hypothetical protein OA46_04675 [Enterobacter cloacae]|nr:hypothetical protein OA46_04675 [Enterobacter cloacae]
MYIVPLVKPGSHIVFDDRKLAHHFSSLLRNVEDSFYEANVALNLFTAEIQKPFQRQDNSEEKWRRDCEKKGELEKIVRKEMNLEDPIPWELREQVDFEVSVRLKKEAWSNGLVPMRHRCIAGMIYAKSFLYALDSIDKMIQVICKEEYAPAKVSELKNLIAEKLPNLKGIRDSSHHTEDRIRGLKLDRRKGGKRVPIELQPLDNELFVAPEGILITAGLINTKLTATLENGKLGEVDVTCDTLVIIQNIIEELYSGFEWIGPRQYLPD